MEEQFRIGSCYRQRNGIVVRLVSRIYEGIATCVRETQEDGDCGGGRNLTDGLYACDPNYEAVALVPGELHNVNGQWLPISVTAPVVEEKKEERVESWGQLLRKALERGLVTAAAPEKPEFFECDVESPNARMLANDLKHGPAKPYIAPAIVQAPKSTAHPSIPSLSLSPDRAGADHRLGGFFVR